MEKVNNRALSEGGAHLLQRAWLAGKVTPYTKHSRNNSVNCAE